jgi:GAF domain-containing protein
LSKIMLDAQPMPETLTHVAELAKESIPGALDVSVTLMQNGKVFSVAFTGSLAVQLDERQYEAGFGPCVDAALSGKIITIEDTAASEAYSDFGRMARRKSITHTRSIGLSTSRQTVGALNVYGAGAEGFDETSKELATAFAGYAAVAVANAGVYASAVALVRNLQRALESRAAIDQAKGILMGRHGLSAEDAFDLLAEQSQHSNRKVREIAQEMVDQVQRHRR